MNLRIILILYFSLLAHFALAQKKWEGGLSLGLANYLGDLVDTPYPRPEESQLTYGLHVRYRLRPEWGMRLHYIRGSLAARDANSSDADLRARSFTFSAPLSELALGLDYELRGKKRLNQQGHLVRNIWSPYGFVQAGLTTVVPEPGFGSAGDMPPELKDRIRADKEAAFSETNFSIGGGLGLRIDLDRHTTLNLEAGIRTTFSDYLDGISQAADPDDVDAYTFVGIHFSMDIGPPDFDADGVPDHKDECPQTRGPAELDGCPDTDKDGIANIHDACPRKPGLPEYRGCPDTDGDGVADPDDHCPEAAGPPAQKGCPPDTDRDGLPDADDRCPTRPGDRDMDGCPDTDGDGVADPDDHCPTLAGSPQYGGCPSLQAEEEDVLARTIRAVRFQTGNATLLPHSLPVLDQVAELLLRHPEQQVIVHGFTDNTGTASINQRLSEARAKNCALYLMRKGVPAERLQWKGWGARYPVAPNDTPEGRKRNRRVEFELLLPGTKSKYR